MSRRLAVTIVYAYLALLVLCVSFARSATIQTLQHRQHRQEMKMHRYHGTIRFFRRHPRLARTTVGRREIHRARIWLGVLRRELRETRLALRPRRVAAVTTLDSCTRSIILMEGGFNPHATNPTSGAYGAPQALPGRKMASAGPDWADNLQTQIRWMIGYETQRYGSPCAALAARIRQGWY